MEIPKNNKEKLPLAKNVETVTLPVNERDKQKISTSLHEIGNRLQAYAEPDTIAIYIRKTVLHEELPEGFEKLEPPRLEAEMIHTETKDGRLKAELTLNGAKATLHPDPLGEYPGIWSVKQKGSEDKLFSHEELLFDKLYKFLPKTKHLESLLDRPTVEDGDVLRTLTESLVQAGAKRETYARYAASDMMIQGDFSSEDSFFDTTIGSEIVVSHGESATRYVCITKQSFEIADFSAVQLNSLADTELCQDQRNDIQEMNDKITYGTLDSTYRFDIVITKDGKFKSEAQLTTESSSVPERNLRRIAKQAEIVGVPAEVFTHTIENVSSRHLPERTTPPTAEQL